MNTARFNQLPRPSPDVGWSSHVLSILPTAIQGYRNEGVSIMKTLRLSKFLTLVLLTAPLLSSPCAVSASLERASDISSFIYGQRGLGVQMDSLSATNFGHITDDPWMDQNGALQQFTSRSIQAFEKANQYVTLGATHGLSIFPQGPSQQAYLIDMYASINAKGVFGDHGSLVVIGDNSLKNLAYADAGLNQTFRILAGTGENVGDAVKVSVRFDANVLDNANGSAYISSQWTGPFRIMLNGTQKWELPGNRFDTPGFNNIVDLTFNAVIGDTVGIGYMAINGDAFGPAVFANYAMNSAFAKGAAFDESTSITLMGGISVNAVPEPETWAMLLTGLGLVGLQWSRKPRNRIDA
jgi:hypothetical protein